MQMRDTQTTTLIRIKTMTNSTLSIQVQIKNVYGSEMVYPVCDNAKLFAEMVGRKTLTARDISSIKKLGYTITVKQRSL